MKFVLSVLCCLYSLTALGGPIDEKKADAHLKAVAAGDLDALMADYDDDAYMDWVGGALDGRYRGKAAIREVWVKFIANNDGKPRPVNVGKPVVLSNPKGTSISVGAEYSGKNPVKVWHWMVYRDGVMNSEIWQIAPNMKLGD